MSYGIQSPFDELCQYTKVLSSSVAEDPATGEKQGILLNVSGVGGLDYSGSEPTIIGNDDVGEGDSQAELFGQLGVIARPLPAGARDHAGRRMTDYCEAIAFRSGDGLTPFACRDNRLQMGGSAPGVGVIAVVGYGGGFVSLNPIAAPVCEQVAENGELVWKQKVENGEPVTKLRGTTMTMYVPYDFDDDGVAQRAHAIILDPTQENELNPDGNNECPTRQF
jgi:hypothetical protein